MDMDEMKKADDTAYEIDRLTERCSAYKGQVEAGAAEIAALKARVAELEAALSTNPGEQ
jgi:prefoldin subunit 5